jgi:phage terminase large subunit
MGAVELPTYAAPLFEPYRYKVLKGGRGSAKSYTVAKILLLRALRKKRFVLCAREFQNSMADSVHKLLEEQIYEMNLDKFYNVQNQQITSTNGSKFIFKGVWRNTNSIKSIPGLTDLWIEEAHTCSKNSWDVLIPTLREEGSEIWVTYNPENEDDPTHVKFCGPEGAPPGTLLIEANHADNPWFPNVLKDEMDHLRRTNYELYLHVWEGQTRTNSDAQIFRNKFKVDYFQVSKDWDGPYFGADWGFSVDPTALVKVYLDIKGPKKRLLISEEAGGVGVELDDIPELFDTVSEVRKRVIRADNARPETISYIARQGFAIEAAEKWKGSVEDGIEWLKSFDEIIIHPRCKETANEFRKYSYKIDRLTQDITTDIVDAYNHYIDAIRYAFQPLIMVGAQGSIWLV